MKVKYMAQTKRITIGSSTYSIKSPNVLDLMEISAAPSVSGDDPAKRAREITRHVLLNWVIEPKLTPEDLDDPAKAMDLFQLAASLMSSMAGMDVVADLKKKLA